MATFPQNVVAPTTIDKQIDHKVLSVNFGRGYTQSAVDGKNAIIDKYVLRWDNLLQPSVNIIQDFLNENIARDFEWLNPLTNQFINVRQDDNVDMRISSRSITSNYSVTFIEAFNLG